MVTRPTLLNIAAHPHTHTHIFSTYKHTKKHKHAGIGIADLRNPGIPICGFIYFLTHPNPPLKNYNSKQKIVFLCIFQTLHKAPLETNKLPPNQTSPLQPEENNKTRPDPPPQGSHEDPSAILLPPGPRGLLHLEYRRKLFISIKVPAVLFLSLFHTHHRTTLFRQASMANLFVINRFIDSITNIYN